MELQRLGRCRLESGHGWCSTSRTRCGLAKWPDRLLPNAQEAMKSNGGMGGSSKFMQIQRLLLPSFALLLVKIVKGVFFSHALCMSKLALGARPKAGFEIGRYATLDVKHAHAEAFPMVNIAFRTARHNSTSPKSINKIRKYMKIRCFSLQALTKAIRYPAEPP